MSKKYNVGKCWFLKNIPSFNEKIIQKLAIKVHSSTCKLKFLKNTYNVPSMAAVSEFQIKTFMSNKSSANKWIMSYLFSYKFLMFMMVVLQIVATLLQSLVPVYIGVGVTLFSENQLDIPALTNITWLVLVAGVGSAIASLLKAFCVETVSQRFERDSRDEFYSVLIGKSLTFHDKQQIGDLMSRAAQDIRQLNFMMSPGVNLVFNAAMGLIIPLILIAQINLQLLLFPGLFLISFLIVLRKYNRDLEAVSWKQRKSSGKISSRLNEVISGMYVVRGASQENQERNIFHQNVEEFKGAAVQSGIIQAHYYPLLLLGVATALAFFHGLLLLGSGPGHINVGQLVAFLLLLQLLRFPTFSNIFAITVLSMGFASAKRILELINAETLIDSNPNGYKEPITGHIAFSNVTFGYNPDTPVLKNINFKVEPGQTVALVGMTGSGKTTITKLLSRLYDPQLGSITIDGIDLRNWSLESLRSQMAVVEQDVFLFSKTIKENILVGNPAASMNQIIEAAKLAQAHTFIEALPSGYNTVIGERGITLSGGQRQRIAIARAILKNPAILILDDASSAIDSKTEDEIQTAIRTVLKGRVSFLITHRIAQIRHADVIVLVDKGEIIASGTHEQLLETSTKYRSIFDIFDEFNEYLETLRIKKPTLDVEAI